MAKKYWCVFYYILQLRNRSIQVTENNRWNLRNLRKFPHNLYFEEVLQGLQPHHNLERISITSYHGSRFPNWMSTLVFRKLKEINLSDCPRCERLPSLGKLPCLARLGLCRMDCIKCLDEECYGDGECSFPALTKLSIREMSNLEKWAIDDSTESFPCLKDLSIKNAMRRNTQLRQTPRL